MKRQLDDIDRSLPRFVVEEEGLQDSIHRINTVFSNVDALLLKKQRVDLALNTEPQIKQKVLRLYVRHEFYAATEAEKSYFLVTVEGMLLDNVYDKTFNLTHFFERISLQSQTEKKYNQGSLMYDWKEEDFPLGGNAHSVQAKVYSDKPALIKLSLHRSTAVTMRYNISDQLRGIIPYLRFDPSEEEVLLAVWQYIELNGLFVAEKDKRYFKLTEVSRRAINAVIYICLAYFASLCMRLILRRFFESSSSTLICLFALCTGFEGAAAGRPREPSGRDDGLSAALQARPTPRARAPRDRGALPERHQHPRALRAQVRLF